MRTFLFWGELTLNHRWIFKMTLFKTFMVPLARAPLNKLLASCPVCFQRFSIALGSKPKDHPTKKTACLGIPLAHVLPGSSRPVAFQWPLSARPHTFGFSTCPELETVPCVQPHGSAVMLHQSHANHASRLLFVI